MTAEDDANADPYQRPDGAQAPTAPVTVADLIEQLRQHGQDLPVYINPGFGVLNYPIEIVQTCHLGNEVLHNVTGDSLAVLIRF